MHFSIASATRGAGLCEPTDHAAGRATRMSAVLQMRPTRPTKPDRNISNYVGDVPFHFILPQVNIHSERL